MSLLFSFTIAHTQITDKNLSVNLDIKSFCHSAGFSCHSVQLTGLRVLHRCLYEQNREWRDMKIKLTLKYEQEDITKI